MNPQGAQPRNDSLDILTVYNPSDQPFEVSYDGQVHTVIQPKKAIQMVKLVAGDENHGAIKHLIDRMCKLQGAQKNEPSVRAAWLSKILINQKTNHLPKIPSLVDIAKQTNQELAQNPIKLSTPQETVPVVTSVDTETQKYIAAGYKFHPVTGAPLVTTKKVIKPEDVDTSHIEIQTDQVVPANGFIPPISVAPLPHTDPAVNALLQGIRTGEKDEGRVIGEVTDADETPAAPLQKNWPDNPTKEDLIRYAQTVSLMNVDNPETKLQLETQSVEQLKSTLKYDVYA